MSVPIETWPQVLLDCQQEIANHPDTYGYYQTRYRSEELIYWPAIPKFIAKDKQQGKVFNNVLDIGCAYGTLMLFVRKFIGCSVYGIDFVSRYHNIALCEKWGMNWAQVNIELDELPAEWPVSLFDAIIMTESIEHFNFHPLSTMKKISALLNPGATLYLSTPDASDWGPTLKYKTIDDIPHVNKELPIDDAHIWQYTLKELSDLLNSVGLCINRIEITPGVLYKHINLSAVKE